jgi:hypothetical protein
MEPHQAIHVRMKYVYIFLIYFFLGQDWSRHDSSLSGIASRMPDGISGLFHHQYTWPCSVGDSNMGILCIETNCHKNDYNKH